MPQIVLSTDKTTWVGKELYPNERYISFDESDIILDAQLSTLATDIEMLFDITICPTTHIDIIKLLARQLCNPKYTNNRCLYFSNYKAKYGVSKYIGNQIKI